jgi:hypothetical protein
MAQQDDAGARCILCGASAETSQLDYLGGHFPGMSGIHAWACADGDACRERLLYDKVQQELSRSRRRPYVARLKTD